jgi:cytochrome c peroxidase
MRASVMLSGMLFVLVSVMTVTASRGTAAQGSARPAETPTLDAEVELGRLLFWDPVLSGHRDVACATCHHPEFAYADGRALSLGVGAVGLGPRRADASGGEVAVVRRNSMTILNAAFNGADDRRGGRNRRRRGAAFDGTVASVNQTAAPMFWDNRVRSLETQALEPLKVFEEMRGDAYPEEVAVDRVIARLREIPEYVALFKAAFGADAEIDASRLGRAIAAFERTLVAMNSPVDRFRAGNRAALTPQQQRGLEAFEEAGCDECHDGPMFSDFDLHAEGVAKHPALAAPDSGGGRFRFRTPSLRNVALTAPYMHNGTLATLEDVLRFYDEGHSRNPNVVDGRGRGARGGLARLDGDFRQVDDMTDREQADIIAFLHALTDPEFDRRIPARVPSGLPPGGHIVDSQRIAAIASVGARRPLHWCPGTVIRAISFGARRPAGKARRVRILAVFERGATQPAGMPRPKLMR